MNLRIARKIVKAVGTPDEARYNQFQIGKAYNRVGRTRDVRESDRVIADLCHREGVEGLAQSLARIGEPSLAFSLLMRAYGKGPS